MLRALRTSLSVETEDEAMASFYRDNEDIRFYVDKGVEWGPLVELTEYLYRAPDGPKDVAEP